MAWSVSNTFRTNCYDPTKKQRMVFVSDNNVVLTNEDISAENSVKFNLTAIKSNQIMFGEMNGNTVNLTVLNQDGRIKAEHIYPMEFRCYVGVEVAEDEYDTSPDAISAVRNDHESISVHSTAPYVRGNIKLGSTMPQLLNGWDCKIMLYYDRLYFVVENNGERYYARHDRVRDNVFGSYQTPSDLEIVNLDRLMDDPSKSGISLYKTGFQEYGEKTQHTVDTTTWGVLKNTETWGSARNTAWGEFSGYTSFARIVYETVPYGVWHFDRPRRVNTAVLTLNGRDRMSRFDADSRDFMAQLASAYRSINVRTIIQEIAGYCGLPVNTSSFGNFKLNTLVGYESISNLSYQQNKSLKDLLSYGYEVAASSGIIDREGMLRGLDTTGTVYPLPHVYSFDVADSVAHTIGKVLIYRKGDFDLYQTDDTVTDGATYEWSDNPFFTNSNPSQSWFSNNLHKKYGGFHNAITVADCDYSLWVDDVYSWEQDGVTYVEPIFTMSVEWNGFGTVTYTNDGTESREYTSYSDRIESVSSINDQNLQGFNQAQYEDKLEFGTNGLTVHSRGLTVQNYNGDNVLYADANGDLIITGMLSAATGSFSGTVDANGGHIGNWNITQYGLRSEGQESGVDSIIALEPRYGVMSIQAIGKGQSLISISSYNILFEECDNDGNLVQSTSGEIRFFTNPTYNNLWIGYRAYAGSTKTFKINLIANHIYIYGENLEIASLPTSADSANMIVSNNRIYRSSSLRALKDNIKTIENASEKVDNLRGVSFTSKCESDDPKRVLYGFIAEEVEKAVPELASYENGKLQSVQYDRVCALLVEDNKACHKKIAELERRLEELERRIK